MWAAIRGALYLLAVIPNVADALGRWWRDRQLRKQFEQEQAFRAEVAAAQANQSIAEAGLKVEQEVSNAHTAEPDTRLDALRSRFGRSRL